MVAFSAKLRMPNLAGKLTLAILNPSYGHFTNSYCGLG